MTEFALERTDDRDRPAAADQRRRLFPFGLQRAARDPQHLVLDRQRDGGAAAMAEEFRLHVRRQARGDESAEGFEDPLGVLLADEPERDLGAGLGRQHGLRALAGVAADDPVHFAGRPRPQDFQAASGRARPPTSSARPRAGTPRRRN